MSSDPAIAQVHDETNTLNGILNGMDITTGIPRLCLTAAVCEEIPYALELQSCEIAETFCDNHFAQMPDKNPWNFCQRQRPRLAPSGKAENSHKFYGFQLSPASRYCEALRIVSTLR